MWYLLLKAGISGVLVMAVSEIARRNASFGALVASLPLISVLGMVWLWQETQDRERLATHAGATFWMVLPSLPMFLLLPLLLRQGMNFYYALALSCALTVVLYLAAVWLIERFGGGMV